MDTLESLRAGQGAICIWICEGEEPTEHILNELLERMSDVLKCQERIFVLSEQVQKQDGTLAKLIHAAPNIRFAYVDNMTVAEPSSCSVLLRSSTISLCSPGQSVKKYSIKR